MTHEYVYRMAAGVDCAPHVPKIYHYFARGNMHYIVMEYIDDGNTRPAPNEVAEALQWLRSLPAPNDDVTGIGPVGGGPACHMLFKGHVAPLNFSSIGALQIYMNSVCVYFTVPAKLLSSNCDKIGFGHAFAALQAKWERRFQQRVTCLHPV
jgi:hypothetical protein